MNERVTVVAVDGPKVERIVENLLTNAARHTPPGTTVWIRVRGQDGGVLIGFMSHLILDEVWAVQWRGGLRLKSSFGTALKLWDKVWWANISAYAKLIRHWDVFDQYVDSAPALDPVPLAARVLDPALRPVLPDRRDRRVRADAVAAAGRAPSPSGTTTGFWAR